MPAQPTSFNPYVNVEVGAAHTVLKPSTTKPPPVPAHNAPAPPVPTRQSGLGQRDVIARKRDSAPPVPPHNSMNGVVANSLLQHTRKAMVSRIRINDYKTRDMSSNERPTTRNGTPRSTRPHSDSTTPTSHSETTTPTHRATPNSKGLTPPPLPASQRSQRPMSSYIPTGKA